LLPAAALLIGAVIAPVIGRALEQRISAAGPSRA
jgi:hypothetical protein